MAISLNTAELRMARHTMHAMKEVAGDALIAGRGPRWIDHILAVRGLGAHAQRIDEVVVAGTDPGLAAANGWVGKALDYASGASYHAKAGATRLGDQLHLSLDGHAELQGQLAAMLDRGFRGDLGRAMAHFETSTKQVDPQLLHRMSASLDEQARTSIGLARSDAHEAWYRINVLGRFGG